MVDLDSIVSPSDDADLGTYFEAWSETGDSDNDDENNVTHYSAELQTFKNEPQQMRSACRNHNVVQRSDINSTLHSCAERWVDNAMQISAQQSG